LIAPPRSGPRIADTAITEEMMAMYFPYSSAGTAAVVTTPTIE
jgi:hypothetical protein